MLYTIKNSGIEKYNNIDMNANNNNQQIQFVTNNLGFIIKNKIFSLFYVIFTGISNLYSSYVYPLKTPLCVIGNYYLNLTPVLTFYLLYNFSSHEPIWIVYYILNDL